MLYGIIRVVFFIILVAISIILFQNTHNKKLLLLCIFLTITIIMLVWFVPFENVVISFDSPQAVFEYAGYGEIIDMVDNTNSVALITKTQNNNFSTFFVKKNNAIMKYLSWQYYKKVHKTHQKV